MAWLVALLIIIPWIAGLLSAVGGKKRWTIFHRLAALLLFGLLAVLVRAFTETRLTAFEIDGFTWMQWPFGAASTSLRIDAISIFFAAPIALIAVGLAWDSWSLSRMISGRPFILVGIGFWFAGLFSADLLAASLCFALAGLSLASIDQGLGADRQSAVRQIWLESSIFLVLIGLAALAEMNDGSFLYSNIGEYESLDMVVSLLVAQSIARLALAAVHNVPAQFSHREAVASRMALFNGTIALYWLARVVVARYNLELTYFPSELSIGIAALAIIATVVVARRTREPAWQLGFFWSAIGLILASAGTVTAGLVIFLGTSLAYAGRRWHRTEAPDNIIISAIVWTNNLSLPGSISFAGYLLLLSNLLLLPPDWAVPLVALMLLGIILADNLSGLEPTASAAQPEARSRILARFLAVGLALLALAPAEVIQEVLGPVTTNFFPAEGGPAGPQLLFVWNYVGTIPFIAATALIGAFVAREVVPTQLMQAAIGAPRRLITTSLHGVTLVGRGLAKINHPESLGSDRTYVSIALGFTLLVTFIFLR